MLGHVGTKYFYAGGTSLGGDFPGKNNKNIFGKKFEFISVSGRYPFLIADGISSKVKAVFQPHLRDERGNLGTAGVKKRIFSKILIFLRNWGGGGK